MTGRRRGRTGRGWDAAPPRPRPGAGRSTRRHGGGTGGTGDGEQPVGPPSPEAGQTTGDEAARPDPAHPDHSAGGPAGAGGPTGGVGPAGTARDPAERAREICLRQLAVRPRTRAELATVLRRHDIPDRVAAEVLDRYHEVGMIDDTAFARAWVSSRHHGKGLARRALGHELRRRGVAPETVEDALAGLDTDTEAATARELVDRRLRSVQGDPATVVRRLVGMLARKGYPAGLAYRVVKEALAEQPDTAGLAEQLDPDALAEAAQADSERDDADWP